MNEEHELRDCSGPCIESSKRPELREATIIIMETMECFGMTIFCCILIAFIFSCVILSLNYNSEVMEFCGEYLDFMLISLISPLLLPCLYCLCIFVLPQWEYFITVYFFVFGITGLVLNTNLSQDCISSIRKSTPPFPLLLFLGWLKCIAYISASVSKLFKIYYHHT
jgi:hypothetical protein